MMSHGCFNGSIMSNIYLVALLVSNASGNVEAIDAVDTVTQGSCINMARVVHVRNDPTPSGYELKFTCGSREALDTAIAEHQCHVVEQKSDKETVTTRYACEPNLKNKVVGWVRSVL
jgi:hypothetical protein